MATVNWSLQHKRDTAANWTSNNPTLLAGQLGIETDGLTTTPKFKIGDGTSTWTALPYFYGGSASAQDLNNVLTVGNTTSGQDIVLTDDDKLQVGSTAGRYIGYDTNLIQIGLGIVNTNSNDHIVLQDGGGIHIDTSFVELPHLTASRVIATDANNRLSALTGTGFLTLNAGVISYDSNTYLTTSAAALAYQPLDSDLTSWAGVTRASGFDTFTATPSSANLSSLLTDKTGTGVNVFGTSPTFTTDITTPKIIGSGTTTTGLTLQTSVTASGAVARGVYHSPTLIAAANNDELFAHYIEPTFTNGAFTGVRNFALGLTAGTGTLKIGNLVGVTTSPAFYFNQTNPSAINYGVWGTSTFTGINATSEVAIQTNGSTRVSIQGATQTFSPTTASGGAFTNFTFNVAANTGQTASTEISNFKVNGASKTWANGGGATTIASQRWNYFTANTAATSGGGSLTINNSYGLYAEAATASGVTITNNWALGTNGGIFLNGTANTVLGSAALATNATTGFLHVPSCAGTPTGTPTLYTGMIPICADSTNNKLYIYSGGAWVALN